LTGGLQTATHPRQREQTNRVLPVTTARGKVGKRGDPGTFTMLFLTYWFVIFAAITFPAYWLVRYRPLRLLLLFLFCAVFHTHFAGPAGVLPIVVLAVTTYLVGLTRNRSLCAAAIVLCVASLVFYKYTRFVCLELVTNVWWHAGVSSYKHLQPLLPELPPLAISFFVFEFVHYLYDVRRGFEPLKSPLDFALFSVFWPSIVAGPVKRYQQFLPALYAGTQTVGQRDVAVGLVLVAVGLVKKFIADNLTAYLTFNTPIFAALDGGDRWLFFAATGLRILLDFSGYSDMAIGFARMFGVGLPANFNWPYLSTSLVDFWHRWHISLSTWIRDYVYIPIGGSRHGLLRKVVNGLVAFGLCGLWHGAAWHFLIWGLYHGVGLAVCSNYRTALGRPGAALGWFFGRYRVAGWALTLLFVNVGWLFFFFPVHDAVHMLGLLVAMR
jgi:alginate O-acetyltransferase complex protein AlgI